MTPRKFFLLYDEHLFMNGYKKQDNVNAIDLLP